MLTRKIKKENGLDIITVLFRAIRKVSPKDLWAREDPEYPILEAEALKARGFVEPINRKENFSTLMQVSDLPCFYFQIHRSFLPSSVLSSLRSYQPM